MDCELEVVCRESEKTIAAGEKKDVVNCGRPRTTSDRVVFISKEQNLTLERQKDYEREKSIHKKLRIGVCAHKYGRAR